MGVAVLSAVPSMLVSYSKAVFAEPVSSAMRSMLSVITHTKSVDGNGVIDQRIVKSMVDEGMKALTGKSNPRDAWSAIFPSIKSTDVVGIKINCINSRLHSNAEVINAIASGLNGIGVADNNIIVWDRSDRELKRCGFPLNNGSRGIRFISTPGYDPNNTVDAGKNRKTKLQLSRILTDQCDHLINIPVLKDHSIAGVTLSMKNHYGTIDRPWSCHSNNCDPFIPQINAADSIKDKTRLIVTDALLGIYEGGPHGSPQWANRQLFFGTDPVALDYSGMLVIEQKRQSEGRRSILRKAHYIQTAAKMGLGTNHPGQITLRTSNIG